jgi:hypothetical protein
MYKLKIYILLLLLILFIFLILLGKTNEGFRNNTLDTDLIVEPRKHEYFIPVVKNYIKNKPNNTKIQIFHGIIIYFHIAQIGDWEKIVIELIDTIKSSGLYNICNEIRIGFLGNTNNISKYINGKIKLVYTSSNIKEFEHPTLNHLLKFAKESNKVYNILYIHNKGSTKPNNNNVTNWRKMMMYFLVENYTKCLEYLKDFDTVGCNLSETRHYKCKIMNENHNFHYSGNFWWSKTTYIKKLPGLQNSIKCKYSDYRLLAESWILYKLPNLKCLIIRATPETHLYNKSYDRSYYKKKKKLETITKNMDIIELNKYF